MTTVRIIVIVLVTILLDARSSAGQAAPTFRPSPCVDTGDPDLWLVATGGFWKLGKRFGHFRVVVLRRGIEHATEWAQIQVLESDDRTQKRKPVSCIDLETPGLKGYTRAVTFRKVADKMTAVEIGIEMKLMGEVVLQDVFLVSNDGKVSKVVDAKAVDLGGG